MVEQRHGDAVALPVVVDTEPADLEPLRRRPLDSHRAEGLRFGLGDVHTAALQSLVNVVHGSGFSLRGKADLSVLAGGASVDVLQSFGVLGRRLTDVRSTHLPNGV